MLISAPTVQAEMILVPLAYRCRVLSAEEQAADSNDMLHSFPWLTVVILSHAAAEMLQSITRNARKETRPPSAVAVTEDGRRSVAGIRNCTESNKRHNNAIIPPATKKRKADQPERSAGLTAFQDWTKRSWTTPARLAML